MGFHSLGLDVLAGIDTVLGLVMLYSLPFAWHDPLAPQGTGLRVPFSSATVSRS